MSESEFPMVRRDDFAIQKAPSLHDIDDDAPEYLPEIDKPGGGKVFEDPHDKAASLGLVMFEATDLLLMLDLDGPNALPEFHKRSELFIKACDLYNTPVPWIETLRTTSKSGFGNHVYLRLREGHSLAERLALQSALGSDTKRDMLSVLRRLNENHLHHPPVVLFETPAEAVRVEEWLRTWAR